MKKQLYEQSSQFRNWCFSKSKLQETREKNHASSVEKELRKQALETTNLEQERVNSPSLSPPSETDFLTLEDEIALYFIKFLSNAKITKESVFELELIISRSLRYEYMIHHPYLPAFGFFLDLQLYSKDSKKIQQIYEKSKEYINTSLFTDAMFIYQPSQIALSTIRIASKFYNFDIEVYLKLKFNSDPADKIENLYKILDEIELIIKNYEPVLVDRAREVDARLRKCKNPEKNPNSEIFKKRKSEREELEEAERHKKKRSDDEYQNTLKAVFD
ncbi:10691_t:CDS:2 [Entrophospora sp. SA101]|nr:10691_t:CDS:2 [Entrophospora sp. SA101]CAJ0924609.1 14492_t:CDS:2 [Entrophospora sp. SA101]